MAVSSTSSGSLKTGVCLSTDRPDNPYNGQVIYETDTNRTLIYDNSAWVVISDPSLLSYSGTGATVTADAMTVAGENVTPHTGRRNLLYNGAMQVAQRGTSTSSIAVAPSNYYTADRWLTRNNPQIGVWTQSIESDAPSGSGFVKSLKMLCTTAESSPSATDLLALQQRIEGQDVQHVKKGTSNAESLTVTFWVKSNVTGTFIASIEDPNTPRYYSKSYTISVADTWEKKTIVFPPDTTGTVPNNTSPGLNLWLMLAAGGDYTSGSPNTAWAGFVAGDFAAGQTNLASAVNNYWQVTGVQLELGDKATPFEHRSYGEELALCQRYFERVSYGDNNVFVSMGLFYQTTLLVSELTWKVLKRADPTITLPPVGSTEVLVNGGVRAVSSVSVSPSKPTSATVNVTTSTSHTAGYPGIYRMDGSSYSIDAEL